MQSPYLDLIAAVERLHRQFLEVVKLELDMVAAHRTLRRLDRFWTRAAELGSRAEALLPAG